MTDDRRELPMPRWPRQSDFLQDVKDDAARLARSALCYLAARYPRESVLREYYETAIQHIDDAQKLAQDIRP